MANRKQAFRAALTAVTVLLALAAPAANAAGEATHLLDETLSLTGDCSTSSLDLVPDPGCPGGLHPPAGPFASPSSVATDPHGDIYVDSAGPPGAGGETDVQQARIDIFSPSGRFITEVAKPGLQHIAVDSSGHLYVDTDIPGQSEEVVRFEPTVYKPETEEIEYGAAPVVVRAASSSSLYFEDLAVNRTNDHLYVDAKTKIIEYGTAAEGNPLVTEDIGKGVLDHSDPSSRSIAVDATHHLIYASDALEGYEHSVVRVFDLNPPYLLLRTIDGTTTPAGHFITSAGKLSLAADEQKGHVFVGDIEGARKAYELEAEGGYVGTFKHGFESLYTGMSVDNSPQSANRGYLFVPSGVPAPSHLFAFQPKPEPHPPVVESVSIDGVTESEAVAHANVNPKGSATHYTVEFATLQHFEEEAFSGATVAGEGDISAGVGAVAVSAPLTGLIARTPYRVRVRVESQCEPQGCNGERQASFTTFTGFQQSTGCANAALKSGPSTGLPDCRVYELVTPSNTNSHEPRGPASDSAGPRFGTPSASPDGTSLAFLIFGGPIPGLGGAGGFNGDTYVSTRTSSGWQTASDGPDGEQSGSPSPGGLSPDHGYIGWSAGEAGGGSLLVEGKDAEYVRYPDGSFHLTGLGSLGEDPKAHLQYIASAGSHILFTSRMRLEAAAPEGKGAIYDRTPDGVTHVVSLLPQDVTPSESAVFDGVSEDGSVVAFELREVGSVTPSALYLRVDNTETLIGSSAGATFAGISDDGRYLFYVREGNLYRFDDRAQATTEISETGDVLPVNIPRSGLGAYFVSPSLLGEGPNPSGATPVAGEENLYYWDGVHIRFVGALTEGDIKGELVGFLGSASYVGGFDEWLRRVGGRALGDDPTRSSVDGSVLLFRSRARLTSYDAQGKAEIYRYDSNENALTCVSCNPTQVAASSDAKLISLGLSTPLTQLGLVPNLSADGRRAFFETSERLVASDNDNTQDVYEWEAQGEGSCLSPGGCLFLISSGQSARPNYLFGASESGNDVFVSTSDLLAPGQDTDETPSVYDARAGGGFPGKAGPPAECLGDACQPVSSPPSEITPATFPTAGNLSNPAISKKKASRRRTACRHGHRLVGKRKHKTRCVASVRRSRHGKANHRRAGR